MNPPARGLPVTDQLRHQIVAHLPRLRRFALALAGDADSADDLVQETCTRALSRLDQWQHGTRLDSWMFRIAQNIWIDRVRARKIRGVVVDFDAMRESIVVQKMMKQGKHRARMAFVTRMLGINPKEDLHGMTFYGREICKHTGVMLLHASLDRDRLIGMAKKLPNL